MRKLLFLLLCVLSFQLFAYEVVVLSDTHCDGREFRPGMKKFEGSIKRNLDAWEKRMPELLKTYRNLAKDAAFVIHCGDLAQGYFGKKNDTMEIRAVTEGINTFAQGVPCKFYCIKGNHETYCVNPAESSDKVIAAHLKQSGVALTGLNYAIMHEGDLFVFFDSNTPDLEFVRRAFAAHPDARHTFFVSHFPVLPCTKKITKKWLIFKDRDKMQELLNLLASRNAIVLCGHIHQTTLVRAEFPAGSITQASVYSLPVTDKILAEQNDYPGKKYLTDYMEQSEKEIPPFYLELLRENYRSFAWYMPGPGVYQLSVTHNRIELRQYSYSGKLCNTIPLCPETAPRKTKQK